MKILLMISIFVLLNAELNAQKRVGIVGTKSAEIMADLGLSDEVVCIGNSTANSNIFTNKVNLGLDRSLYIQKIKDLKLSHFIYSKTIYTKEDIGELKKSGVKIIKLNNKFSLDGIMKNVRTISKIFGKKDEGQELNNQITVVNSGIELAAYMGNTGVKTLYLDIKSKDEIYCAGKATPAEAVIGIAMGKNICRTKGWEKLGAKQYKPKVIICNRNGFEKLGGEKVLANILSKSGIDMKNVTLYVVDEYPFLSFGTRTPAEIEKLISFYGNIK